MKKSLVIILAVAIIGGLGVYTKAQKSDASNTAVQGAQTSTQAGTNNQTSGISASQDIPAASYNDGTYTGTNVSTIYGPVQVQAVVSGGKITEVNFLKMPSDEGHTREVTAYSEPLLKQQTIKNQSAKVDFISGATQTSEGYEQSLQAALNQAV